MKCEHSFKLVTASLTLVLLVSQGCSDPIKEHEQICRQNMKVIVHDEKLWREFRAEAEAAHQREIREDPPIAWRPLYVGVGDFKMAFGENRTFFRKIPEGKIVRNDLYIMKSDKTVVQIVDFAYYNKGSAFGGGLSFDCLKFYDKLIIGKR